MVYATLCMALIMSACSSNSSADSKQEPVKSDLKSVETEDFSINYPATWELNESGLMGTTFALYSPQEDSTDFRENVNLLIHDISAMNVDLDKYIAVTINGIYSYVYNSEIVTTEGFTMDGRPYHKLVYTGEQGGRALKWMQYCTIRDQLAYLVTFTSTQADFDANVESGEAIMKTFRLK